MVGAEHALAPERGITGQASMQEFNTFVYLDVQKTGSTFVTSLLERFFPHEKIRKRRHVGVGKDYDRSKFYFISVRDPLDQYASLYSYGCDLRGGVFKRINDGNNGHLYDGTWAGFRMWLRFVLQPENASLLDANYSYCGNGRLCELIGFQSYRVLLLALPDAATVLAGCTDKKAIRQEFRTRKLHQFAVRYEKFRADLAELLNTSLRDYAADLDGALAFVKTSNEINASDRIDRYETDLGLGNKLDRELRAREWLLYEEFGYDSRAFRNRRLGPKGPRQPR